MILLQFHQISMLIIFFEQNYGSFNPKLGLQMLTRSQWTHFTKKTHGCPIQGAIYNGCRTDFAPISPKIHVKIVLTQKYGLFNPKLGLHMLTRSQWTHSTKKNHGCPIQGTIYNGCRSHFGQKSTLKKSQKQKKAILTPNCGYICSHDPNGYISAKKPTGALYRERSTTGDAPISTGAAPRAAIFGQGPMKKKFFF